MTDYKLTKKFLGQGETDKLQNRFDLFKEGLSNIINKDNDENTGSGGIGGGGGGGDDGTPPRPLPPDIFDGNIPAENSRRIAQANDERFQNRRLREREILNIPRGIVKSRRSNMDINFPDTLPPTPYRDDFFDNYQILLAKQVFYFLNHYVH